MKVLCGQCGLSLSPTPDDLRRGACDCPSCGHRITLGAAAPPPPADDAGFAGFAEQAKKAIARRIVVVCGKCGKKLHVGLRQAGRAGRCPACQAPILIPEHNQGQEFPELSDDAKVDAIIQDDAKVDAVTQQEDMLEVEFDDELSALAASVSSGPRTPAGKRRRRISNLTMVLVAGIILLLISVPTLLVLRGLPSGFVPTVTRSESRPDAPPDSPDPATKAVAVVPPVATKAAATAAAPIDPVPHEPSVTVVDATPDVFGAGRYSPAPPGQVYWRVTAVLRPEKSGSLQTAADVSLTTPAGAVPSRGVPTGADLPGPPAQATKMTLRPDGQHTVTFVFVVPDTLRQARLSVKGLGEADVGPVPPLKGAPRDVAGDYLEQPPRNLKPLLKNAVMAAVQNAPSQRLELRAVDDGSVSVRLPVAGVSGTAKRAGRDILDAELALGQTVLPCRLRVLEGGKTIVLYLSDKPYHQITFSRG
jgi:DNA-directed RNA polymerase subunit RPC12/RpoP